MKFRNRLKWKLIRDYCIGWTAAFVFLCIVRGVGTTEQGSVQFDLWTSLLISVIVGVLFGSISGYAQVLTERVYKRIPIRKLLLVRLVFALVFLASLIGVNYWICTTFLGLKVGLLQFVFEPGSFAIYFYILFVDVLMVVFRQIRLMLGENNLSKLLTGRFYAPREEERIFMFLDLQSSTHLAEKLGHVKYSMMIQDCFNDLGVVAENEAEIYQYVGDEVILTWKMQDGLRNHNCINAYFNFKWQLNRKANYYKDKYGIVPFFKAGMNAGVVTVTEVGRYKKEIAYHGDTINTAARIQSKCNDFNEELLISEGLKNRLQDSSFTFSELGSIALKGKEEEVLIYAA